MLRRELARGLGALALSATACGPRDRARQRIRGTLAGPSVERGHALRAPWDRARWVGVTPTRVRVAIVGAGPAGLAAAWWLRRSGLEDVALLELEPEPGGTSRAGRSAVTAYPYGAHYLPVPHAGETELVLLLTELGALDGVDEHGEPRGAEEALVREPAERTFFHGYWHEGLRAPAEHPSDGDDRRRFRAIIDRYVGLVDTQGRRAFTMPAALSSEDPALLALDDVTAAAWLDREGLHSPALRWSLDYACRDDFGLPLARTSAWALLWYFAARIPRPGAPTTEYLTWPEGNGAIVRHLAGGLGERLRQNAVVRALEPAHGGVRIFAEDAVRGAPFALDAEQAIVCVPELVARRIVAPSLATPADDADRPRYGSWVVANLHLRRRPRGRGFGPAWDNVLWRSRSLGYVDATHQQGRPAGPTVWTYYLPLSAGEEPEAREALLAAPWTRWRDAVLDDLGRAHPDLDEHVERIDVWRWGHAMAAPGPGAIRAALRRRRAAPAGPVHLAQSDLSGIAVFEEAFHHGVRAAKRVLAALTPASLAPRGAFE